jgi:hypothetical protein
VCEFNYGENPRYCFAAYDGGRWVKGCKFDKAPDFTKAFAMSLITGKPTESFLKVV